MTTIANAPTHRRWNASVRPSTRSADFAITLAAPHMVTATRAPTAPATGRASRPPASGEGDAVVEGRALLKRPTERFDDLPEGVLVHSLSVRGTGGARDVLVHQGAAEVVGARLQHLAGAARAHLDPRHLHVRHPRVVSDPP